MERPSIPHALVTNQSSSSEQFQNEVIRPIIKGLHHLLINHFRFYLSNKKIDLNSLIVEKQLILIESVFQKDVAYRQEVKGLVIGQFSVDEFEIYKGVAPELNKRIVQIIKQRIQDSISELL